MPRLIDADALEKEYRNQFESVYKHVRDSVKPSDFFVERKAAYDKELVRLEMEAFCEFLQSRPTIDAEPVRHGWWIAVPSSDVMTGKAYKCSECNKMRYGSFMPNYCQNCGAKMDGGKEDA